jgi:membrane associated rhomboid family serine protease
MSDVVTPEPGVTEEETYCYAHPKTPTRLRCSRCDRPICGRCAIPASVGQHCPECVAEARKSAPKVRSAIVKTAPAVVTIIALNVAVYVAQLVGGGEFTNRFAAEPFGIANGEYYRLFTAMFLHSLSFRLHIFMNMFILFMYGPLVEQAFGWARFVAMYLVAGFMGSAVSYAFRPCGPGSVGASGAIFGVVGILIVYFYNRRNQSFVAQYLRSMLLFVGINLAIGFIIPGIDYLAHMGGLAGGMVLGAGIDQKASVKPNPAVQMIVLLAVAVAAVALVAWRTANYSCGLFG